jgi:hypothetical protein
VKEPRKNVSIYNFHYARPPVTVAMNYHLGSPIGDNETGFAGIEDDIYRVEAWSFMMAGGALFNHLDYSFTADNEDGTFIVTKGQPGGGSKTLRNQLQILAGFMQSLNFINMKPVSNGNVRLTDQENTSINGLVEDDKVMALYLARKDTISTGSLIGINLSEGSYSLNWIDTRIPGETTSSLNNHPGGWTTIESPAFIKDVAVKVIKTK